ncbi:Transportin-3 (Importin-12) (Imp12) (Transportin-SR) (TRN-SR) [Durusdinium trenchii]|uniref:Transportin-3 (Importin-12) (Imp12) (Transportin-SR) (TRN-SR) n=1 Tax=Durusdinium trenchii TaxID=1381693 RepID=A0ABP0QWW2_9DINO
MEQVVNALQALYATSDPQTKKQADDWLTKFQQTPAAWQVSDTLLSQADAPMQFRFFAAQTMRTKVQFDFYELPADSYMSLRDSMLVHIDRFRAAEHQPIHTMLAIGLADLAIQMDHTWPNAVETLFQRFGQSPESYPTLLEVLRMLPEENNNYKLMTDSFKRESCSQRLQAATPQVVQFLLNLQCPTVQARRKVLECFLSWIKYTNLQASDIAQNPLIPECFKHVVSGGNLSETATDIIVELLRMCSSDISAYQPVIEVILSQLGTLRSKFETQLSRGMEVALDEQDSLLQVCRIYVEVGECLVPLVMTQCADAQIVSILQVILRCTDLPSEEISSIPLEFWHRLADEVCRHPETDVKIDQFQGVYLELLSASIRRCTLSTTQDPFLADDEIAAYRQRILGLVEDCLEVLTPNTALEHVLKSLLGGQQNGVVVQEAHFFVLTMVASRAEVREGSVLWQLIQSLPPLISATAPEGAERVDGAILHFTKKTAIELLGNLWQWVKTRPDFLRSSLEMISMLLMASDPPNSPNNMLERTKQVQQAASMAFKEICVGGKLHLQDLVPQLTQLYVSTIALPIRMHLFIVDGVGAVVASLNQEETFRSALEHLVTPLVQGLNTERERPVVLSEILDRLTTIIRQIHIREGSAKAACVGQLISSTFWPVIRQCLAQHPADSKLVEKSCRLLKHSMRCVPDLFKPNLSDVARTLVTAFQQHQHSSYLYSAEILAHTYAKDPEIVPVLTELFNQLSSIGLQCLMHSKDKLEEITELVEDFFGMFERYLRFAPRIVLEAPTLQPTMQLWSVAIFVQQKEAVEAIIAFIESVLSHIGETFKLGRRYADESKAKIGQLLQPHALQVAPGFVQAIFRLIAGVPTKYVQDSIPSILDHLRSAFSQEFPAWLEAALTQLPPSVGSKAELQKFGEHIIRGDDQRLYEAIQDLCYRCEQVVLRSRGQADATVAGRKKK